MSNKENVPDFVIEENQAPYYVARPEDILLREGKPLRHKFSTIVDPENDEAEMEIDLGDAEEFIWAKEGELEAGAGGDSDGGSIAIFPGSTKCAWGSCGKWPITITLTDKPAGDRSDNDPKRTVYEFYLEIIGEDEVKPDPAAVDESLTGEIELVDTTGETNPNPETIETATGEVVKVDDLTDE